MTMMDSQEKYVHSLKEIKETEEKANFEIDNYKKNVLEEVKIFQISADNAIEIAKSDGEKLVESNIEQARKKGSAEMDKIIEDAKVKSKTISTKLDPNTLRGILDILLKGLQ